MLIGTAINMHSRTVEQWKAGRWWVPLAIAGIGLVGGIASTVAGVLIGVAMGAAGRSVGAQPSLAQFSHGQTRLQVFTVQSHYWLSL